MSLKKICSFVVVGLLAVVVMPKVYAANSVTLSCNDTKIAIGQSTNCTAYLTYDYTDETLAPKGVVVVLEPNEFLDVTNVKANSTLGWQQGTATETANGMQYQFATSNPTGIQSGKKSELFSFTLTLNQKAKNLSDTNACGNLCINGAVVQTASSQVPINTDDKASCYSPIVTVEECVGPKCNPETGSFLNYALVILGIAVAGVAIVVVRRSNKFYRV